MHQFLIGWLLFFGIVCQSFAQQAYEIKLELKNYDGKEAYLAHYYGNRQVATDTVAANDKGQFIFSGTDALETGAYMVVLPPKNIRIPFLIDGEEQRFLIQTDTAGVVKHAKIKGSKKNKDYYAYLHLNNYHQEIENALKLKIASETNASQIRELENELRWSQSQHSEAKIKLKQRYDSQFLAVLIGLDIEPVLPELYPEGMTIDSVAEYRKFKMRHYFDHIDLLDPRLMRTPRFFRKVDQYVNFISTEGINPLTPAFADSITASAVRVFDKVKPVKDTYKYLMINFLSHYATAKVIGLDAVYVNLVERYIMTGQAPFLTANNKKEVIRRAYIFKPILMGKIAPDIKMELEDSSTISLHEVDADYTILLFWRPKCGSCKKAMPALLAFYEKYKNQNIKVFGACTYTGSKAKQCWSDLKEKKMQPFINTIDPRNQSKFLSIYDVRTTPRIIILDKDKRILAKRVGSAQLEEVLLKLQDLGY